jgi:hypothetical protein
MLYQTARGHPCSNATTSSFTSIRRSDRSILVGNFHVAQSFFFFAG